MMRDFEMHSVEALVQRFIDLALAQDAALLHSDTDRYNQLFDESINIIRNLKSRRGDQRSALTSLYVHANAQVRYFAAVATLEVQPIEARKVLETISGRHEFPQAANARGLLSALNEGLFPRI